jgi:hypothetical protein
MIERIQARIAELETEQAEYLAAANMQLARYASVIAELRKLVEEDQDRTNQSVTERSGSWVEAAPPEESSPSSLA